jgi:hypothetical protein
VKQKSQPLLLTPQLGRAAERNVRKLESKMTGSIAIAAWQDEATVLSESNIQENDPAERKARKQECKAANWFVFSPEDAAYSQVPHHPSLTRTAVSEPGTK